jgi:hypothetical protein
MNGGLQPENLLVNSKESVNNITDALAYSKVCTSWVPRSQTYYQKTVQEEVCTDLLSCDVADDTSSRSRIITGFESLAPSISAAAKMSMEWRHPTSPWQGKSGSLFFGMQMGRFW